MIDPARVVERTSSVGTVPTSVAQVFTLINDPRATASDFERVIRPDVGLTANLLRCANSAYYRATREITSVRDAISRMGLRRVFELAAGASFAKAIPSRLAGYDLPAADYWTHAVATAVLADRIGREAGFTYPDLAFTAGLLHDIGKLVISCYLSADGGSVRPGLKLVDVAEERAELGIDHAALGETLALGWALPKDIAGACRWHHAPLDAPTATLRSLSAVVQVADGAAHSALLGLDGAGEQEHPAVPPETLEHLGLDAEAVATLVEQAREEIKRTNEMLSSARR